MSVEQALGYIQACNQIPPGHRVKTELWYRDYSRGWDYLTRAGYRMFQNSPEAQRVHKEIREKARLAIDTSVRKIKETR